ncbi:MAG: ParB/RepB/Spo0J family partition protein [Candidatus Omnitrophica bacterium]|nr:ParB/RepB/Spo0J family partition protein [Candidatus Omnitrophota bacterium]
MERKVLGKGLGALISPELEAPKNDLLMLDPEIISANRYQPRLHFREEKLHDLIESIKEKGIVQPLIVRKHSDKSYELIAGERRLRAAKELGLDRVPVVVKEVNDQEMLELSIVENIQRDDLNSIEEAKAYAALIKNFGFTQEHVARSVGKSRATVANTLRLLTLPKIIQDALFKDQISMGHAKAILSLPETVEQLGLLSLILKKGLSVREAEQFCVSKKTVKTKSAVNKDEHVVNLEEELCQLFGTKVSLYHGKKRGKIQIEYYSLDDLDRVLKLIRGQ